MEAFRVMHVHMSDSHVPTISFKALKRARTTIEDFTQSYFPYHDLRIPQDLFKHFHILVWVEGTIYQLDEDNEQLASEGRQDAGMLAHGMERIRGVLRTEDLLDDRLGAELAQGQLYWEQEQTICLKLRAHPRPLAAPADLSAAEVLACHEAKSFDYRVLNFLLYRLTRRPYDEHLLAFLRLDEMLVDISDDLVDYEDDVCNNTFNIFRCYIHLYGRDAELKLIERISGLEAEHGGLLEKLPERLKAHYWQRHKEASVGQGSERWVFPPPIYDEEDYRRRVLQEEAAEVAAPRQEPSG